MNVIVIVTDSMRADHLGCHPLCQSYRGIKVQTPNLDKLASEGTLFEEAYAESLPTMPTRRNWWTGRVGFPFQGWQPFENDDYLLSEVLWDRGYTSALISDTYHMHKPVYNCGRGFDTVVWIRGQEYDPWIVDSSVSIDLMPHHRLRGDDSDEMWRDRFIQNLRNASYRKKEEDYSVARVVNAAKGWLDETVNRQGIQDKLFLWVDCFDPHEPWDPPQPYASMYDPDYKGMEIFDPVPGTTEDYMTPEEIHHTKSQYAGEITMVDKWVGTLLDHIRDLGLYENTLIVHISDHGEPFGEHGIIRKASPWNYEELARIPWIIRHPKGVGAGKRVREFVQSTDFMPTILDFLDIPQPLVLPFSAPRKSAQLFPQDVTLRTNTINLHGQSVLKLMSGEADKIRDYVYTGHHNQQWTIRSKEWSYHYPLVPEASKTGGPELYHRSEDLTEQVNVADRYPDVADELELQLWRWVMYLK